MKYFRNNAIHIAVTETGQLVEIQDGGDTILLSPAELRWILECVNKVELGPTVHVSDVIEVQ